LLIHSSGDSHLEWLNGPETFLYVI
jgi:hypothetical protein